MRLTLKLALIVLGALAAVWLVFSWFEAEQEVRILCSMLHPGLERDHVIHTLEAGGGIALPPMEIPGHGTFAIFIQGGIQHGLWRV